MNGISNIYINKVLSVANVKDYAGVFSIDNLPLSLKERDRAIFIINLSPSFKRKGSHFITILKRGKSVRIYDSLKLPSYPSLLHAYFERKGREKMTQALTNPVQCLTSSYCGFFCIYYALKLDSKYAKITTIPFKTRMLRKNDQICIDNIVRMLAKE